MLSDAEVLALPDHPEDAFLQVERIARDRLDRVLAETNSQGWYNELDYMTAVLAAARHYRIEEVADWKIPHIDDEHVGADYQQFRLKMSGLSMELSLRRAQRIKQSSIAFDPATKVKLRALLDQMRQEVDNEPRLTLRKRDALISKIAALSKEVDTDWARSESVGSLMIELAEDTDEAAGKLDNVRRWFGDIAALLGKSRREQGDSARLPPPREPKRIEPPTSEPKTPRQRKSQGFDKVLDDEIPF